MKNHGIQNFRPLQMEFEESTGQWLLYLEDPRYPEISFVVLHSGSKEDCEMLCEFGNELLQVNARLSIQESFDEDN